MKIEVPHSRESEQFIKDVFNQYTEVKELPLKTKGRVLIHLYPKQDTMINGSDKLTGYKDAYNCEVHFYFTNNMTVYKTEGYNDAINLEVPCGVRIFKDLSTILIVDEPVTIGIAQAISIWKTR